MGLTLPKVSVEEGRQLLDLTYAKPDRLRSTCGSAGCPSFEAYIACWLVLFSAVSKHKTKVEHELTATV